jgi:nucleoid-associated protein YgaU
MSKTTEAAPGADANTLKSNEIARTVLGTGVRPDGFRVEFSNGTATLRGSVQSEEERKRVLDAVRGVGGVSNVADSLTVGTGAAPRAAAAAGMRTYTVKSGDTLSKIAKAHYGDASKYQKIFEANRKILSDPDLIHPGQVLTIPE